MSKLYVYQIKGILERPNKDIGGMRVLVCSKDIFQTVDVPASIFDKKTLDYLKFRLSVNDYMNVNNLPMAVLKKIRTPMGQWLDNWVLTWQ